VPLLKRHLAQILVIEKPHLRRLRMTGIMTPGVRLNHFRFRTSKFLSAWCLLHRVYIIRGPRYGIFPSSLLVQSSSVQICAIYIFEVKHGDSRTYKTGHLQVKRKFNVATHMTKLIKHKWCYYILRQGILVNWTVGTRVKQPWYEADHSLPLHGGLEWVEHVYTHSPIRLHGVVLN
jgi:hypothetical protein